MTSIKIMALLKSKQTIISYKWLKSYMSYIIIIHENFHKEKFSPLLPCAAGEIHNSYKLYEPLTKIFVGYVYKAFFQQAVFGRR